MRLNYLRTVLCSLDPRSGAPRGMAETEAEELTANLCHGSSLLSGLSVDHVPGATLHPGGWKYDRRSTRVSLPRQASASPRSAPHASTRNQSPARCRGSMMYCVKSIPESAKLLRRSHPSSHASSGSLIFSRRNGSEAPGKVAG
jgi:hypothetical protein